MLWRKRRRLRKPRYEAVLYWPRDDRAWMVCDTRQGSLVAARLHRNTAERLAHTLNVADLTEPLIDYSITSKTR